MKTPRHRKMRLSRETVRTLGNDRLHGARGGGLFDTWYSCETQQCYSKAGRTCPAWSCPRDACTLPPV